MICWSIGIAWIRGPNPGIMITVCQSVIIIFIRLVRLPSSYYIHKVRPIWRARPRGSSYEYIIHKYICTLCTYMYKNSVIPPLYIYVYINHIPTATKGRCCNNNIIIITFTLSHTVLPAFHGKLIIINIIILGNDVILYYYYYYYYYCVNVRRATCLMQ